MNQHLGSRGNVRSNAQSSRGPVGRGIVGLAALALVAAAMLPVDAARAAGCDLDGDGTPTDPYQVADAEDLALVGVGDCGLAAHYLQTDDIVLAAPAAGESNHHRIGGSTNASLFTGVYDGKGHTIAGLVIVAKASSHPRGLFTRIAGEAVLRNIHLVDVDVTSEGQGNVGAIVGESRTGTVVEASSASGVIRSDNIQFGGLVGLNGVGATIRSSWSSVDVAVARASGNAFAGGLVGDNEGTIEDSYATGDVSNAGSATPLGGLAGRSNAPSNFDPAARILRSYSRGEVTSGAGAADVGGLVGAVNTATGPSEITASFWDLDTSTQSDSAGGVGKSTAEMKRLATYVEAGWAIVAGRAAYDPPTAVWGICEDLNDGYPYLLWQTVPEGVCLTAVDDDGGTEDAASGGAASATPVLVSGAAPVLATGQGVWQQTDGTAVPLAVASPAANQVRYAVDGLQVTLTGAAGTSVANGLVANAAGEVECEICATLASGGVIEAWMFSEPRLVAAWRVEDLPCQRFTIPVVAPLDGGGAVTSGAHTLQLALPTASGMQAVNVGVTVGGPVPASVPAGDAAVFPTGLLALMLGLFAAAALVVRSGRRDGVDG
jgi:hypothetical protein